MSPLRPSQGRRKEWLQQKKQQQQEEEDKGSLLISLLSLSTMVVLLSIVMMMAGEYHQQYPKSLLSSTSTSTSFNLGHDVVPSTSSSSSFSSFRTLTEESTMDSTTTTTSTPLNQDIGTLDVITDDTPTHSAICKKYLFNFLNGTTDIRDECKGFKEAYKAADCADQDEGGGVFGGTASSWSSSSSSSFSGSNKNKNKEMTLGKNDSSKDGDDMLIDDFLENWECCDSIQRFYTRNCETSEGVMGDYHSVRLLAIMIVLLVCAMLKAMVKHANIGWLPEACVFIIVGTVVGGILRLFDSSFVGKKLSFDNDLFLQILLPPIIFQAALSIDKKAFRRDLFPILSFASIGTAFSAVAIGWITHQVSRHWGGGGGDSNGGSGGELPLLDSLVFGSLMASIDPVATLSILSSAGVSQTDTLYTLVFGESLLNDGVAIVLFDTLKSRLGGGGGGNGENATEVDLDEAAYHEMANHFAAVLFGSIGIGLTVGFCCTLYFYVLRGQQTAVTEVAVFFCWALVPYYIAEAVGWSGIISIMVMGFFMDYFVVGGSSESDQQQQRTGMEYMAIEATILPNGENYTVDDGVGGGLPPSIDRCTQIQIALSKAFCSGGGHILSESKHHVGFVAHVIANLMETAIFAYLGLFLFSDNVWNLSLNLTAILSCVSSRALMVIGVSFLINTAVFFDLENQISKCLGTIRSRVTYPNGHNGRMNHNNVDNEDDDVPITGMGGLTRVYLDRQTQLILMLSGVRGAVSFTLVESIPVWDPVTKVGSHYKAELKAMTSTSIVFTLFVFGALTYMTVIKQQQQRAYGNNYMGGSRLGHRLLLNETMEGDDDDDPQSNSSPYRRHDHQPDRLFVSPSASLEIDHHHPGGGRGGPFGPTPTTSGMPQQSTDGYQAPTNLWHE